MVLFKRIRHRMTRRRLIAFGAVALTIGLIELPRGLIELRRRRLESIAVEHESKMTYGMACSRVGPASCYDIHGKLMTKAEVKSADWHAELAVKYRTAALKPWLLVGPDPPPP